MPIYEYIAVNSDKGCRVCREGFELNRPLDRAPLEFCLLCRQPVRKKISRVNNPQVLKPLSVADAKKAGFTVLERRGRGEYERL